MTIQSNAVGIDTVVHVVRGHTVGYAYILIVLKKHDGDAPSNTREFHILMWDYKNGRYKRIISGTNGRFIVPAMWWILTCMLRPRLSLDSSDI